jgi:hypothetical protein
LRPHRLPVRVIKDVAPVHHILPVHRAAYARHTGTQVGELVAELLVPQRGLAGKQDPLELAGVQVDQGALPVRRGVLVLMSVVCSKTTVGKAVDLLSGPGGLAGFLRRRQFGVGWAG